jgi:hypothetical protein
VTQFQAWVNSTANPRVTQFIIALNSSGLVSRYQTSLGQVNAQFCGYRRFNVPEIGPIAYTHTQGNPPNSPVIDASQLRPGQTVHVTITGHNLPAANNATISVLSSSTNPPAVITGYTTANPTEIRTGTEVTTLAFDLTIPATATTGARAIRIRPTIAVTADGASIANNTGIDDTEMAQISALKANAFTVVQAGDISVFPARGYQSQTFTVTIRNLPLPQQVVEPTIEFLLPNGQVDPNITVRRAQLESQINGGVISRVITAEIGINSRAVAGSRNLRLTANPAATGARAPQFTQALPNGFTIFAVPASCTDGRDNDLDNTVDFQDSDCRPNSSNIIAENGEVTASGLNGLLRAGRVDVQGGYRTASEQDIPVANYPARSAAQMVQPDLAVTVRAGDGLRQPWLIAQNQLGSMAAMAYVNARYQANIADGLSYAHALAFDSALMGRIGIAGPLYIQPLARLAVNARDLNYPSTTFFNGAEAMLAPGVGVGLRSAWLNVMALALYQRIWFAMGQDSSGLQTASVDGQRQSALFGLQVEANLSQAIRSNWAPSLFGRLGLRVLGETNTPVGFSGNRTIASQPDILTGELSSRWQSRHRIFSGAFLRLIGGTTLGNPGYNNAALSFLEVMAGIQMYHWLTVAGGYVSANNVVAPQAGDQRGGFGLVGAQLGDWVNINARAGAYDFGGHTIPQFMLGLSLGHRANASLPDQQTLLPLGTAF